LTAAAAVLGREAEAAYAAVGRWHYRVRDVARWPCSACACVGWRARGRGDARFLSGEGGLASALAGPAAGRSYSYVPASQTGSLRFAPPVAQLDLAGRRKNAMPPVFLLSQSFRPAEKR
jgi:hypothetical protein